MRHAAKLAVVGAVFLAACSTSPPTPPPQQTEQLTHFAFSQSQLLAKDATPLGNESWVARAGEARVPVFDTGTTKDAVIQALRSWGLRPFVGLKSIIVIEGPSRHNFAVEDAEFVIYGFNDGALNVGPLNADEMVDAYIRWGMHQAGLDLIMAISSFSSMSASSMNSLAWAHATSADASKRSPPLALYYGRRANESSGWQNEFHLDTLAAAYAASGNFDRAVELQQHALERAEDPDQGMKGRLVFYQSGLPFIEQAPGVTDHGISLPKKALFRSANGGDSEAQFEIAWFFLKNSIEEHEGLIKPGLHYLRLAAAQDNYMAIEEIGVGYLRGVNGLPFDAVAAEEWLVRASDLGSELAPFNLGLMYRDAIGTERNDTLATRWLMLAADRGVTPIAVEVAYRIIEGVGIEPNRSLADKYFALAKEDGIGANETMYGEHLYHFEYVENSAAAAVLSPLKVSVDDFPEHLMQVVDRIEDQVARESRYIYARFIDSVTGWPADDAPEVILSLTHSAATLGSKRAQLKLVLIYENDETADPAEVAAASDYWRNRAKKNHSGL